MSDQLDALLVKMKEMEAEVMRKMRRKEADFFYRVQEKKVRFTEEALARHRQLS